jgi:hypothetical protein
MFFFGRWPQISHVAWSASCDAVHRQPQVLFRHQGPLWFWFICGFLFLWVISRRCKYPDSVPWKDEWCIGKDLEGNGYSLNAVLCRYLAGRTEEDHEYLWLLFGTVIAQSIKRRMIRWVWYMNRKGLWRKRSWPSMKYFPCNPRNHSPCALYLEDCGSVFRVTPCSSVDGYFPNFGNLQQN